MLKLHKNNKKIAHSYSLQNDSDQLERMCRGVKLLPVFEHCPAGHRVAQFRRKLGKRP